MVDDIERRNHLRLMLCLTGHRDQHDVVTVVSAEMLRELVSIAARHAHVQDDAVWSRFLNLRRCRVPTDSKHALPIAPNLLNREFTVDTPDSVWTGDIYIATGEGWLYLAAVIDLFSRQVVGWSMQPHMQASLVTDALRMAWFRRQPAPGLVFHSDRGSQYCGNEFQGALKSYGMKSSMSRKGNCWDTQFKLCLSVAFGLTRAGIGVMPLR